MAKVHQANLREIGLEGFALIDKFYGKPSRSNGGSVFPVRQGCWVVQVPSDEMDDPAVINSKDAAVTYGEVMVMNYSKGIKRQNHWIRPYKA